jgi:translation initiation factor 2A
VLIVTSTDVDKTGESYYGKTMLFYMDIKGDTAAVQTETDTNSIHAAEWSPTSTEFCIITGKMPNTRAVLFNTRCEKIFDMDISARNTISFNPQGNLLLLCAFGNLQGKVEVWEVKKYKKLIATLQAPDTTQLHWLSDGVHFITATTAPRMQVGNGFKVWDFTGKCVKDWKAQKHLLGITPFHTTPALPFPEEKLDLFVKQIGNKSTNAKLEESKPAAYVPIHKRKGNVGAPVTKAQAEATMNGVKSSGDSNPLSEKEKKIRTLKKKIGEIDKLKEMLKEGKQLEKNQKDKLTKEAALIAELEALELS